MEPIGDGKVKLKSSKSDYLHRPDSSQEVTTWSVGIGNEWLCESLSSSEISFDSANTSWSATTLDNNGAVGWFYPPPWEFHQDSMNAGTIWHGSYTYNLNNLNILESLEFEGQQGFQFRFIVAPPNAFKAFGDGCREQRKRRVVS